MGNVMTGYVVEGRVVFCEAVERYRVEGIPNIYSVVLGVGEGTCHRFICDNSYPVGTRLRVSYVAHNVVRIERLLD